MIVTRNPQQNGLWELANRERAQAEKRMELHAKAVLQKQANRFAKSAKESLSATFSQLDTLVPRSDFAEFFAVQYIRIAQNIGGQIIEKRYDPIMQEALRQYVASVSGAKISQITETTKELFKGLLLEQVQEGLPVVEFMKVLQTKLFQMSNMRAERIARTEIIGASNAGSYFNAVHLGVELDKVWLSASDARVRKEPVSHVALNGQRVSMQQPFQEPKSGEFMLFPGDTSFGASAKNIVNCRCAVVYSQK